MERDAGLDAFVAAQVSEMEAHLEQWRLGFEEALRRYVERDRSQPLPDQPAAPAGLMSSTDLGADKLRRRAPASGPPLAKPKKKSTAKSQRQLAAQGETQGAQKQEEPKPLPTIDDEQREKPEQGAAEQQPEPERCRFAVPARDDSDVLSKGTVDMPRLPTMRHFRSSVVCAPPEGGWSKWCYKLVHSNRFEHCVGALIVVNAMTIGLEVQVQATTRRDGTEPGVVFLLVSALINIAFTVELGMRIMALRQHFFIARGSAWHWFDLSVVIGGWVETIVFCAMAGAGGARSVPAALGLFSVFRTIRGARIVRFARVIRRSPYFTELRIILHSMSSAGTALAWSMCVLFLVDYVVSCVLTQAATDHFLSRGADPERWSCRELDRFFGTIPRSCMTIFLSMHGGLEWGDPLSCMTGVHFVYGALFFLTLTFCIVAILNIVTGFFVESAVKAAEADREYRKRLVMQSREADAEELRRTFRLIDTDRDGVITASEWRDRIDDEDLKDYLEAIGMDVRDAPGIFTFLDLNGNGTLNTEEFVTGCKRLQGQATAAHVAAITGYLERLIQMLVGRSVADSMGSS